MSQNENRQQWRAKYRPYIVAAALAFALTLLVVPEVMDGKSMEPTIGEGSITVATKKSYSEKRGAPELGQVVLLEKPYSKKIAEDNLVGRVVGLPGEKIEIKEGRFYRDGEEYSLEGSAGALGADLSLKLGAEEVFLLSDNLEEQLDSRNSKLGPVPLKEIKGNIKFILWPFSNFGAVSN
ncbi:MAG: signal peptidase I [Anaerovoracaceae bacterium]